MKGLILILLLVAAALLAYNYVHTGKLTLVEGRRVDGQDSGVQARDALETSRESGFETQPQTIGNREAGISGAAGARAR
jgi:hypothetical protein